MMAAGAILASAYSPSALAAWSVAGDSRVSSGYNDNIRLTVDNPVASPIFQGGLGADFVQTQSRYQLSIAPRVVAWRYPDYDVFNRVDRFLTVDVQGVAERHQDILSLSLVRDSTLTSELGSTGLTETDLPHQSAQLGLSRSIRPTERLTYGVRLDARADRYLDAEGTGLRDYNYAAAGFNSAYRISGRFQFIAGTSVSRLELPETFGYTNDNLAATIGFNGSIGERWGISAGYGPSLTRWETAESRGSVYEMTAFHRAERFDWNLSLSRQVVPSGRGVLTRRERADFRIERNMTERLVLSLSAGWTESRDVVPDDFVPRPGFEPYSLRYAEVYATLRWAVSPTWDLSWSVAHADQDFQNDGATADRNNVMLSLSWSGQSRELR